MNKFVSLTAMIAMIFLSGCVLQITQKPIKQNDQIPATNTAEAQSPLDTKIVNPLKAEDATVKKGLKRFYPDAGATVGTPETNVPTGSTASDPEKSFIITPELIAKLYLADKYKPGVCFGLPTPVAEESIRFVVDGNIGLASFLKQKYKLTTDLEIYNKIKQLNDVQLTKTASGRYDFQFMDGQCCTLNFYQGWVEVSGETATDTVTNQESKTNPC